MRRVKVAVLCPSEIAVRRFMPALSTMDEIEYVGVAVASEIEWFGNYISDRNKQILKAEYEKAVAFKERYGGIIFESYEELINSNKVDAIYIPLPPALHHAWAIKALKANKHVLVEKPASDKFDYTFEMVELARSRNLALHENYMFLFHKQVEIIDDLIKTDSVGEAKLVRLAFGFPFRGASDFRYHKHLGGGALLDCGGYTLKMARHLLGDTAKLDHSTLHIDSKFDVDTFGTATMSNDKGLVVQLSFGMENHYKCELEIWGSEGRIYTDRIFTAPNEFEPKIMLEVKGEKSLVVVENDDTFKKSIRWFINAINNDIIKENNYKDILKQARTVEEVMKGSVRFGSKNK